ncbi:MAG: ABC-F family ATP-binding cassette domain-containing protein [Rhodospirillales bacterium]|nr:ABC-F family ATP-binding cassette domain-containing protein [Rhodospirillales bacterium]
MAPPLLLLRNVHLSFGGKPLLRGAELALAAGDRLCLVGRNGSGKSCLLKVAAGLLEPDRSQRFLQPGATVRYLAQEPDLSGYASTGAVVEAGLAPGDDRHRARLLLEGLGFSGSEDVRQLSEGERRRCAIARELATSPDILLLDEPTNHLDLPAIEWLENELAGSGSALILISHDRRFLTTLSQTTIWLHDGVTRRLERGFADFEAWRDEIIEKDEIDRHKLDRKIATENDWLRYGVTARRKRNQGRLRALEELRRQRRAKGPAAGSIRLATAMEQPSGRLMIEAEGVAKAFGGRTIVADFGARILRGDRIGIVGPNGAGKTTLLNLLTGALPPDRGTVRLGAGVQIVALDQRRLSLDPAASVAETLSGGGGETVSVGGETRRVMGVMKDFLFLPEQARTPVGALSGGERSRLMLAKAMIEPSNLLVLDEPTNDLDLETLDVLEELLSTYAGAVLLVSHDRDFLDRTVTAVIAGNGDGRWIQYAGGYSDMVAQRGGVEAAASEGGRGREQERRQPRSSPSRTPSEMPDQATGRSSAGARRKLSFRQAYDLRSLPVRIEAGEVKIAELRRTLSDPGLYARDRAAFDRAATALSAAEADLAAAEEEWLRLELIREEIEGR